MEDPAAGRPAPLLERDDVWQHAAKAYAAAASGRGSSILVDGPAGTGKSCLAAALAGLAQESRLEVLRATGRPREERFGFGVVVQLFESRLERMDERERSWLMEEAAREAAPIFTPGDRQLDPGFDTLHGLYRLCCKLAAATPLAIVVDDADLADWQSVRFLQYLVHRVEEHPAVVVLTAGAVPRSQAPDVEEIAAHSATTRFRLAPLSPEATARCVATRWPGATPEDAARIHEATAGCPLLVDMLVDGRNGGAEEAERRIASRTLMRAAHIHDKAPALVSAVAVLAPACELRNAAALAALDASSAALIVDRLIEAGILKRQERLAFEQPVLARALARNQAPGERAAAHLAAARLVSADEAPPEAVATHLLQAARTGSAWVVDTLCAAAAIAISRGAPSDAVAYLRRALEEPPIGRQRAHVVLELGRAEAMAGEPDAASRLSEAAEWAADAQEQPAAALATGRALFALGHPAQAMAVFQRALDELGDSDPDLSGRLRAGHAAALWLAGLPEGATVASTAPPESADTPGDRALLALHAIEGAIRGDSCEAVSELAARALDRGVLLDEETADGLTYYLAAAALALAEDLTTAEAALTAAVEDAQVRGSVLGFATASHVRAMSILMRGRVPDAVTDARNALGVERDGWRLGLGGARLVLAHGLLETGDLPGAMTQVEAAEAVTGETDPLRMSLLLARGRVRLLQGDADGALADYLACGDLCERAGARNPAVAPWRSNAGRAYAVVGDWSEAERLIEEELALARAFGARGPVSRALRALAAIHEPQRALEALEEAVSVGEGSQAALERARALVEYGASLRRLNRRREAREPLRAGLEIAQGCGATVLAERAMRETVAAGARPRRTALSGPESLTAREHQVASLAAEGLSNREIAEQLVVTVKTVEWHLKHSYRKLGVRSRQALRPFFENGSGA